MLEPTTFPDRGRQKRFDLWNMVKTHLQILEINPWRFAAPWIEGVPQFYRAVVSLLAGEHCLAGYPWGTFPPESGLYLADLLQHQVRFCGRFHRLAVAWMTVRSGRAVTLYGRNYSNHLEAGITLAERMLADIADEVKAYAIPERDGFCAAWPVESKDQNRIIANLLHWTKRWFDAGRYQSLSNCLIDLHNDIALLETRAAVAPRVIPFDPDWGQLRIALAQQGVVRTSPPRSVGAPQTPAISTNTTEHNNPSESCQSSATAIPASVLQNAQELLRQMRTEGIAESARDLLATVLEAKGQLQPLTEVMKKVWGGDVKMQTFHNNKAMVNTFFEEAEFDYRIKYHDNEVRLSPQ